MNIVGGIVSGYQTFLNGWNSLVTPLANAIGVEPFVMQFVSGMALVLVIPVIASKFDFFKDDIRESLSLSGLVAIMTFFNVFYQNFHGIQVTTVWGELVKQFAGSVVTLLAFTAIYIVLTVDFKKWELIEEITGKSK